jgi:hypothetical protein
MLSKRTSQKAPSAASVLSPIQAIRAAQRSHPAFKFAIVVAGLLGIVAVASGYGPTPATLVFGAIVLVVLMILFLVFAQAAAATKAALELPAQVLVWSFLLLSIATAGNLFSSAFFDQPLPLRKKIIQWLDLKPAQEGTLTPTPKPALVPPLATQGPVKPNQEIAQESGGKKSSKDNPSQSRLDSRTAPDLRVVPMPKPQDPLAHYGLSFVLIKGNYTGVQGLEFAPYRISTSPIPGSALLDYKGAYSGTFPAPTETTLQLNWREANGLAQSFGCRVPSLAQWINARSQKAFAPKSAEFVQRLETSENELCTVQITSSDGGNLVGPWPRDVRFDCSGAEEGVLRLVCPVS